MSALWPSPQLDSNIWIIVLRVGGNAAYNRVKAIFQGSSIVQLGRNMRQNTISFFTFMAFSFFQIFSHSLRSTVCY